MIPIFIICKDRVTVLKQCIEGYKKLGDIKLILIDNGSTYPEMVKYLTTPGLEVYVNMSTDGSFTDISESVARIIEDWYTRNDSPYYIVTDPDIELESPSPKLLEYYIDVLEQEPFSACVGPMLRIDDLPDCFSLKEDMIESHILQFWGKTSYPYKESRVQQAMIDTTFAMYRKGFRFKRFNVGVRVHEPYMARHLDWYIDTSNLTPEQVYYFNHASKVSSMGNHLFRGISV